jgi:hypothetical protein
MTRRRIGLGIEFVLQLLIPFIGTQNNRGDVQECAWNYSRHCQKRLMVNIFNDFLQDLIDMTLRKLDIDKVSQTVPWQEYIGIYVPMYIV